MIAPFAHCCNWYCNGNDLTLRALKQRGVHNSGIHSDCKELYADQSETLPWRAVTIRCCSYIVASPKLLPSKHTEKALVTNPSQSASLTVAMSYDGAGVSEFGVLACTALVRV